MAPASGHSSETAADSGAVPLLGAAGERIALIDGASGERTSYAELHRLVRSRVQAWRASGLGGGDGGSGGAVLARLCRNDRETVIDYLAALTAGLPIALLPATIDPTALAELHKRYEFERILGGESAGSGSGLAPHPSLALLLSTSGSTGSPKMVRLALSAVVANARAIAAALGLTADEVAPTSLPLHYSFGLSLVNSHLVAGATLLLTDESLLSEPFWAACRQHRATSLAGVPYSYQLLRRLELAKLAPPELRTFTQAGGRMEPAMILHFHRLATARGGRLFVMYGQTEATARIAILPAEDLPEHAGAAGRAIEGQLSIADDGEVIYRGPNVMLGYAERRAELARGDDLGGVLPTGDLGRLDDAGRLWITGRKKRIAKVFGMRLNLDELEAWLRTAPPSPSPTPTSAATSAITAANAAAPLVLAAIAVGDRVRVFVEAPAAAPLAATEPTAASPEPTAASPEPTAAPADPASAQRCATLRQRLAEHTGLHLTGFTVTEIPALPRLLGGKIDYQRLEAHKDFTS